MKKGVVLFLAVAGSLMTLAQTKADTITQMAPALQQYLGVASLPATPIEVTGRNTYGHSCKVSIGQSGVTISGPQSDEETDMQVMDISALEASYEDVSVSTSPLGRKLTLKKLKHTYSLYRSGGLVVPEILRTGNLLTESLTLTLKKRPLRREMSFSLNHFVLRDSSESQFHITGCVVSMPELLNALR